MKNKNNWILVFILVVIILCGSILRFYKLGSIPPGLTDDEVNMGYDAYSLLETGKDQWGQSYPIFSFKGFGDYRSPVYTYLLLPLLPFMHMDAFWLKFPAAFFGVCTILLVFFIARKLGFSKEASCFAAFLLAINPWHVGMSRVAMVVIPGVFFLCMGMMLLLYAKMRLTFVICSFIFFALTIYSYPAYMIVTPICLALLIILSYQKGIVTKKQFAFGLVVFLCMAVPYILSSQSSSVGVRMGQVNIFKDSGTIDVLNEKIGACQKTVPTIICKVTFNKYIAFSTKLGVNYIRHFSSDLLYSNGTVTQFSILPPRGLLLSLEFILFCLGIFFALRSYRDLRVLFLLVIILTAPLPDTITSDGHYGRFFVILPFIQLMVAYGFDGIVRYTGNIILIPIVATLLFETSLFGVEYTTYYPQFFSKYSHFGYEELSKNLYKAKSVYDEIYVSSRVNDAKQYIFYLFYTKFDPLKFQTDGNIEKIVEPNGWVRVKRIGNIYFVPSFPETEVFQRNTKNILFIGSPSEFPKAYIPSQFDIKDKKGNVLFRAIRLDDWKRCLETPCIEDTK
jgi:4-amino-4-deoxy-L-arabinose transferase-like glycosyltransferase